MMNRFLLATVGLLLLGLSLAAVSDEQHPLAINEDHLMGPKVSRERGGQTIDHVIVHFSSDVIQHPEDPFDVARNVAIFAKYGVSSNYMIGRDGTVYRLVPDERAAFHAGRTTRKEPDLQNMNNRSIGIELLGVGSEADMTGEPVEYMTPEAYRKLAATHPDYIGFTDAQYDSLRLLLADLFQKHPAIKRDRDHVLGHDEYAPTRKSDPGELFDWSKLELE